MPARPQREFDPAYEVLSEEQPRRSWFTFVLSKRLVLGAVLVIVVVVTVLALVLQPQPAEQAPYWRRACKALCEGPIIAAANNLQLFNDSKEFVDMPLRSQDPEQVLAAFASVDATSEQAVRSFLAQHFDQAGSDVVEVLPPDWQPEPRVVTRQGNATLRAFAAAVHGIWPDLAREAAPGVSSFPQRHTLLPFPRPFVVAGGRFREPYFWDSFWIVLGLLRSEMPDTATALVENLAWAGRELGRVPNGGRAYYAGRSQPPFLALMVDAVVNATGNTSLAEYALPAVTSELEWYGVVDGAGFQARQRVQAEGHTLHRYSLAVSGPRAESWREDMAAARDAGEAPGSAAALSMWGEIAAAAESGWDFSSRWLRDPTSTSSARTSEIVPADLNAVIVAQLRAAARLHRAVGHGGVAAGLEAKASALCESINAALWDEGLGWWSDYDLASKRRRAEADVTPAAFFPLWAGCGVNGTDASRARKAAAALLTKSGLLQAGGLVTSTVDSGQQWDCPGAWAPLQWAAIGGLEAAGEAGAARDLARVWLRSNLLGFQRYGAMLEKYDAFRPGHAAGGGEYVPQRGFGWTNGVALDLLSRYDWATLEPP